MSLVVTKVVGLATIQDFGRRGHMHEAVPPGGALAPERMIAANRQVNNANDEPVIEVLGQLVVRATAVTVVAETSSHSLGKVHVLHENEELTVASGEYRCAYLAIRGGVGAPEALDGRGTLLSAGLGSPLRANDVITSAQSPEWQPEPGIYMVAGEVRYNGAVGIDVLPGPDLDAFSPNALELLIAVSSVYRVLPTSDRVGTRLSGPALPRKPSYREVSRPMVQGALEVPGDGQPIVLGPEHPTTGGYPIIAVIAAKHLSLFHSVRLGDSVRFSARWADSVRLSESQ